MKIVLDAFGGDNSPVEVIKGAVESLNKKENFKIVLVGNSSVICAELSKYEYEKNRIEVLNAESVITNEESPVEAVRKKRNSSIVIGLKALNEDAECKAFVSAGSTGAVLTAATLLIKRLEGVARPALAPVLPTVTKENVILIDCGANSDCKPEMLYQFAKMGIAYSQAIMGVGKNRVGLLNNGVEEGKGNELAKETYNLIKTKKGINFIGNIEAREIFSGDVDVVVTDGFSGNIALKASEGTATMLLTLMKESIMKGGIRSKIGYLLLKPMFKELKKTLDYNDLGGAVLLGLEKVIIKLHGSSKSKSFTAAILQAVEISQKEVVKKIIIN